MRERTVFTVLEETATRYGDAPALYQPFVRRTSTEYRVYSWNDWLKTSREIAMGLRELGLKTGETVSVLSETRAEFYLVDVGIMAAGGIAAALYIAYAPAELAANLATMGARFLFAEDEKVLAKLARAIELRQQTMPQHVILITGHGALTLEKLQRLGREAMERDPEAFARVQSDIRADDPAILYPTSGATGEPKMALTSHAAILANIDMGPVVLPVGPEDSTIVFLPSAHMAQRIVLELVPMRMGMPVWFSEGLSHLPAELKTIRPTIFFAPPRLWGRMYASIQMELKKRPAALRRLFAGALRLGMRRVRYTFDGKRRPLWISVAASISGAIMFRAIRARLGGRVRVAASGAAPLGKNLAEFFAAIGVPIIEGYGLTEAGVICFNPLQRPKPGSVGKVLPGIEVRLGVDNELMVRTPCIFKGYYRDEVTTRSVLREDGWLSTGDLAEVDADGYWYITGRKKEVIVLSNGKKVYPARIENLFKMEPLINEVVLIGDNKPHVTALLTLNMAEAAKLVGFDERNGHAPANVVHAEPVQVAVRQAIARVNAQLADFERIRRYNVLEREFSIEQGELTPTMKVRRTRAIENHPELVNELYLGKED